jgi:hypothetical protein
MGGEQKPQAKKKSTYEQPTTIITDDDIEKNGKESILKNMKKKNVVPFPERSSSSLSTDNKKPVDISGLSRIE